MRWCWIVILVPTTLLVCGGQGPAETPREEVRLVQAPVGR
jgi:hypothetical protein